MQAAETSFKVQEVVSDQTTAANLNMVNLYKRHNSTLEKTVRTQAEFIANLQSQLASRDTQVDALRSENCKI